MIEDTQRYIKSIILHLSLTISYLHLKLSTECSLGGCAALRNTQGMVNDTFVSPVSWYLLPSFLLAPCYFTIFGTPFNSF